MNFHAELIRESDLAVIRSARGLTREEARRNLDVGANIPEGHDVLINDVRPALSSNDRGLGYFCTYVD